MTDNTTVQVAVRVRPLVESEIAKGYQDILTIFSNINQIRVDDDKAFTYNYVFDSDTDHEKFYTTCIKDLIKNLFKGYNVTVLAYGQTGSGKTYSMGTSYNGNGEKAVIPRALDDIFTCVRDNFSYNFAISVSFMELYQEVLYDLLSDKPRDQCTLEIREDEKKNIFIPNLTEHPVVATTEALALLAKGSSSRATSSTNMNAESSRSHAIYTVNICMHKKDNSNLHKTAKFHLVDLAGSERSKKTGAVGQTFKEGININKGLLALGNVMSALGDEKTQHGYIGYRDSNLTRLLKDSLGGNSITLMIACVSPAEYNKDETLSTLRYADRAKKIKNKPVVNQDPQAAEINRLNKLVDQLRLELIGQGGPIICQAELELLKKEISDLKFKNCHLNVKLSTCLSDATLLIERNLTMQNTLEDITLKLTDMKNEYVSIVEALNTNIENQDINAVKENVLKLLDLKSRLTMLISEQIKKAETIRKDEASSISNSCSDNTNSEHEINEKQESHTAKQIALNTELQDVTKQLALKEHLMKQIAANTYVIDNNIIRENENKIEVLQAEKEELLHQLKTLQTQASNTKGAEQRRKRLQELEAQILDLRKKIIEQDRMIKLKEKDEDKMKRLDNEILSMKQTKVQLIKKMREESERFRAWKIQKERDLHKLKDQDRKRLNQITKMEIMHNKQQNVLKRKFEEGVATIKRLKDALAKRKAAQESKNIGKTERVTEWVQQELEIYVNTIDAQHSLKNLLDDKAVLEQQLEMLKSDEILSDSDEVKQLEDDINLRTTQIQEIQQKLIDSDEDNRAQSRWDMLHTMAETKHALKVLFNLVADIRSKNFINENTIHLLETKQADLIKENKNLVENLKKQEINNASIQQDQEEKISVLLRQVNSQLQTEDSGDNDTKELFAIQQQKIHTLEEEKQQLLEKYQDLQKQLEEANITKTNSEARRIPKLKINSEDVFVSDDDDVLKDPDWRKTPLGKRLASLKHYNRRDNNQTIELSGIAADRTKRNSEGKCACKSGCGNRTCGCRKTSRSCGISCKCDPAVCVNRDINNKDADSSVFKRPSDENIDEKENYVPKKQRTKLFAENAE